MLTFFSPPPFRLGTGSPAYLENLQRLLIQDASSGLIEVQPTPEIQLVLLYNEGLHFATYLVEQESSSAISPDDFQKYWSGIDAPMRSIELSSQAMRLAWQALEWYPGSQKKQEACQDLSRYLEKIQASRIEGLVQITFPGLDGFITFVDGLPVISETIFVSLSGVDGGLVRMRQLAQAKGSMPAEIRLYPPRPETTSFETFSLRQVMIDWIITLMTRYQRVVGDNLVSTLDYEINTLLRLKHRNMRLVGNALVDNQLITDPNLAAQIYQTLLQDVATQINRIIGEELSTRALSESYKRLKEQDKKLLEKYGLLASTVADKTT